MARRKRKNGDWHHRVPDFQLVYCGSKKSMAKEEPKIVQRINIIEDSVTNESKLKGTGQVEKT